MRIVAVNVRVALLLVAAILATGCNKDVTAPAAAPIPPPRFAVNDGAHSGGTPHFFFLPPIVNALPPVTGAFDGTLTPTARVCEWTGTTCGAVVADFTTTNGTGGQTIRVDSRYTKSYWVVWDTRRCLGGTCTLDPAKAYRLRVFVGAAQLGFADIKVVTTLAGLRAVDRTQFAPLWRNLPFLIAFRIEQGAVGASVGPAGGIVASADGQVAVTIPAGALSTTTTFSLQPATTYPSGTGAWSPVVDVGPSGTAFATPVTLTLSYDPTKLPPGIPPSALSIYVSDGTGWEFVPGSTVNAVENTVSAPISHFSVYTVAIAPTVVNGVPSPTTISVGQSTTLTGYVLSYPVVPNSYCFYTRTVIADLVFTCRTQSNTFAYGVASQAVLWTALPTGAPVVSLASTRTHTDQFGATTSPAITGLAPGAAVVTATSAGVSATATVTVTGGVAGKSLYVVNEYGHSITVYAAGASGNATPTATIEGANTGLNYPFGIVLDGAGKIYVAGGGVNRINIYAAGASGNATPVATIAGGNTGLNNPTGIALDGAGNIYVTSQTNSSIRVYAAGANGDATPVAAIAGDNTGLNFPLAIALDGARNIYVTVGTTNSINVYAAGASGNAPPAATIAGDNTGLVNPAGIALDGAGNIYVTNFTSNSITVFAAGASGNVTPTATISGANTGLSLPDGIALDGAGNIYVSNFIGNSVTVYAAGARGNVTPTATISGNNTGLIGPALITLQR